MTTWADDASATRLRAHLIDAATTPDCPLTPETVRAVHAEASQTIDRLFRRQVSPAEAVEAVRAVMRTGRAKDVGEPARFSAGHYLPVPQAQPEKHKRRKAVEADRKGNTPPAVQQKNGETA